MLDARSGRGVRPNHTASRTENITLPSKPASKRQARSACGWVRIARLLAPDGLRRATRAKGQALLREWNGARRRLPLFRPTRRALSETGGIRAKSSGRPRRSIRDRRVRRARLARRKSRAGAAGPLG